MLSGLGSGLVKGSNGINKAFSDVGYTVQHISEATGTLTKHTLIGLAKTLKCLPVAIDNTARNLQHNAGLVQAPLDALLGADHSPILRCVNKKKKQVFYVHLKYDAPGKPIDAAQLAQQIQQAQQAQQQTKPAKVAQAAQAAQPSSETASVAGEVDSS